MDELASWNDTPTRQAIVDFVAAALRVLVNHDDAAREFDYTAGAEQAAGEGWTAVSMREDWSRVFAD